MKGETNKSKSDDYNPFEHRKVEKPSSDIRSLANLLKASLGSGLLAMPLAFANSGWAVGIVGTVVIAIICGHCVHIFVSTSRRCCKRECRPLLSYAETCEAAFANGPKTVRPYAKAASIFSELSLLCTYIGVCCIFTVLISDSIKQLLDTYYPVLILPVQYYCLMLLIPLSIMTQIRHLKWLAPFSLLANVLLVATFGICLYYIFKDEISIEGKQVVGDISRFPAFLSVDKTGGRERKSFVEDMTIKIELHFRTVIFAMEGIGVVMPVENVMKNPQHFLGCPGVLVVAMGFILILYSVLGLFGYFRYGNLLKGTITLNLPLDHWPAICAKSFIALSIFFTYPLHFFVVVDIITKYTIPRTKEKYRNITQICLRIAIVLFCGGIGVALPMLEQIINIVGALFYSILGLIIPGVVDSISRWPRLGRYNWILWKNVLIVLFGLISLVSGCAVTISDIIENLRKQNTE